jgi:hypothetical protein
MKRTFLIVSLAGSLVGCVGQIDGSQGDDQTGDDDTQETCTATRSYKKYDGTALESDRPTMKPGTDRLRMKPFAALAAEYSAALGLSTFDTAAYAATFGKPPARWFNEPAASANTIYAAFALAYDGCTKATATDAKYAAAPDATNAPLLCNDTIRRAWHREPLAAETDACVKYTTTQTNPSDAPRVRWAYSCAAVLTASGFLAY